MPRKSRRTTFERKTFVMHHLRDVSTVDRAPWRRIIVARLGSNWQDAWRRSTTHPWRIQNPVVVSPGLAPILATQSAAARRPVASPRHEGPCGARVRAAARNPVSARNGRAEAARLPPRNAQPLGAAVQGSRGCATGLESLAPATVHLVRGLVQPSPRQGHATAPTRAGSAEPGAMPPFVAWTLPQRSMRKRQAKWPPRRCADVLDNCNAPFLKSQVEPPGALNLPHHRGPYPPVPHWA